MLQSEVSPEKPKATIMSIPLELDIMIIERLRLKDALNMGKALPIPEQVALQYFACDKNNLLDILYLDFYDLKPSSFKFLRKNKSFQIRATDNEALRWASNNGKMEIVKLLLSDDRVDSSSRNNEALLYASGNGHSEIVNLIESHPRFEDEPLDDSDFYSSLPRMNPL